MKNAVLGLLIFLVSVGLVMGVCLFGYQARQMQQEAEAMAAGVTATPVQMGSDGDFVPVGEFEGKILSSTTDKGDIARVSDALDRLAIEAAAGTAGSEAGGVLAESTAP